MRETDKKDTRILIQPHPDLLIIPPDPPQLLIKLGQVRSLIRGVYRVPSEGKARDLHLYRSFLYERGRQFTPQGIRGAAGLRPRSFCLQRIPASCCRPSAQGQPLSILGAIPSSEIEALIAERPRGSQTAAKEPSARPTCRGHGWPCSYSRSRHLYRSQAGRTRHPASTPWSSRIIPLSSKTTEAFRAGAEGAEKTVSMLRSLSSLLEDLLLLQSGASSLARNIDILPELQRLSANASMEWIEGRFSRS